MINTTFRTKRTGWALVAPAVFMLTVSVMGQSTEPVEPAEGTESPKSADAPPTLDELLGIEPEPGADERTPAERVAEQESDEELQRRLNEEAIGDAFGVAIQKMSVAADQLDRAFDTGLGTQRVQEEVLARLEFLLEEAKKQPSGSASSSSSPSPQPSKPQPKPGEQQSQQQPADDPGNQNNGESPPPPGTAPRDLNTVLDESRSEWGNLPTRVRDVLLQGRSEKFSSLYEQLTREYYRRLAEDGSS